MALEIVNMHQTIFLTTYSESHFEKPVIIGWDE